MNGNVDNAANGAVRLLSYLPGMYQDDMFLAGFLHIFESVLAPLDRQIEQLHTYADPRLAPPEFLPWLGTWFDLVLDENWPEQRRRTLIRRASDLYMRRGTAGALRDYLAICMDVAPEITEDEEPFHFSVSFPLPRPEPTVEDRVRRIIEEEKPAYTTYSLYWSQDHA